VVPSRWATITSDPTWQVAIGNCFDEVMGVSATRVRPVRGSVILKTATSPLAGIEPAWATHTETRAVSERR
jgi:hypothetical protein